METMEHTAQAQTVRDAPTHLLLARRSVVEHPNPLWELKLFL